MLKLKRKLKYHGHQYYESVRPAVVYDALDYLRNNNTIYGDIDIVMTNIDNELVSFENPQELAASKLDDVPASNYVRQRVKDSLYPSNTENIVHTGK